MPWIWAALMPHPPIIVPEVGRGREREAGPTLAGVQALMEKLSALPDQGRPEALLVLSPHQPWAREALFLNTAPEIKGGLERFGAARVQFYLRTSPLLPRLADHLTQAGLPLAGGEADQLTPDHGTSVPLYYLSKIYQTLPPVILGSPIGLSPAQALELGRTLAAWAPAEKWALLASGDLSHRLTREAPAGYDPEGEVFDREVEEALISGQAESLVRNWPPRRLERAVECGFRSVLTLLGLAGGPVEVLSHEGPFGVGYCHALWTPPSKSATQNQEE